jgi:hypothetical protein
MFVGLFQENRSGRETASRGKEVLLKWKAQYS